MKCRFKLADMFQDGWDVARLVAFSSNGKLNFYGLNTVGKKLPPKGQYCFNSDSNQNGDSFSLIVTGFKPKFVWEVSLHPTFS